MPVSMGGGPAGFEHAGSSNMARAFSCSCCTPPCCGLLGGSPSPPRISRRGRGRLGACCEPVLMGVPCTGCAQELGQEGVTNDELVCPEATAGLVSTITFSWVSDLMKKGYK